MKRETQRSRVKRHLESGGAITPMDALERFGCFRLAAVIHDLKNDDNMNIEKELIKNKYGTKYAKYKLIVKSLNQSILDELNPTGEWKQ